MTFGLHVGSLQRLSFRIADGSVKHRPEGEVKLLMFGAAFTKVVLTINRKSSPRSCDPAQTEIKNPREISQPAMKRFGQLDELATASQTQNGKAERQHEQLCTRSAGKAEKVQERSRPTGTQKVKQTDR